MTLLTFTPNDVQYAKKTPSSSYRHRPRHRDSVLFLHILSLSLSHSVLYPSPH